MIYVENFQHELQQIEVSKSDKLKPEGLLPAREMTRHRGGVGSIGWLVDHCCQQFSFDPSQRRSRQNGATIHALIEQHDTICQID